jgi:hypothetical protein
MKVEICEAKAEITPLDTVLGCLICTMRAYMQSSSSEGGKSHTQRHGKTQETAQEDQEDQGDVLDGSEDEEYELDEFGCPDFSKCWLSCEDCGGRDENGKCKGVSDRIPLVL